MDTLWLIVAGLIVVMAVAILFGVLPRLRRAQIGTQDNVGGAAAILAGARAPMIIGGVAILLFAVAIYLALNKPAAQSQHARSQEAAMAPEHVKAIDELASRLNRNPNDGKGWAMLARTYAITGRYSEAVGAYEKAAHLIKDDAVLLVDYADVLAMVSGKSMQGKPLDLIRQALKIDPKNVKGLALAGTAAFQAGDYKRAEEYWSKLLAMLPSDSQLAKQISAGMAQAHELASGKPAASALSVSSGRITGVVKLSAKLSGKVAPTDTVFVFAKAVSGPGMPVAVMRARAGDLPIKFVLDDSMAMMPTVKLSDHKTVTLSAKISQSGSATQRSGDLKGEISQVKVGASNVQLMIDQIVP